MTVIKMLIVALTATRMANIMSYIGRRRGDALEKLVCSLRYAAMSHAVAPLFWHDAQLQQSLTCLASCTNTSSQAIGLNRGLKKRTPRQEIASYASRFDNSAIHGHLCYIKASYIP